MYSKSHQKKVCSFKHIIWSTNYWQNLPVETSVLMKCMSAPKQHRRENSIYLTKEKTPYCKDVQAKLLNCFTSLWRQGRRVMAPYDPQICSTWAAMGHNSYLYPSACGNCQGFDRFVVWWLENSRENYSSLCPAGRYRHHIHPSFFFFFSYEEYEMNC